ncbi:tRNA (guanosine(37)-N1)-methyltransferase TrmD [Nocardioides pacificus]
MRIDIVSIFPGYLAPLELSLAGRARASGLLDIEVHDLRDWAHDRHRTVDDTPYGGGAGMVMKPEPWGEALDALGLDQATLVVPTPSGQPFTQAVARELTQHQHLIFACGRYEGIDQRVIDHAGQRTEVREISIGDYVLNGGEVAALAITEAVVRLIPGFMGNPDSLVEESHEDGLLEYPVYTKPASWRGLDVPPVLMSGNHGAISRWRHEQALHRTTQRRPDLAHPATALTVGDLTALLRRAEPGDAGELMVLQRACLVQAVIEDPGAPVAALHESLDDIRQGLEEWQTWVIRAGGRMIASVRAQSDGADWVIGRLLVAPDLQRQGIGKVLLQHAEATAPAEATSYALFALSGSEDTIRAARSVGYRPAPHPVAGVLRLVKRRRDG